MMIHSKSNTNFNYFLYFSICLENAKTLFESPNKAWENYETLALLSSYLDFNPLNTLVPIKSFTKLDDFIKDIPNQIPSTDLVRKILGNKDIYKEIDTYKDIENYRRRRVITLTKKIDKYPYTAQFKNQNYLSYMELNKEDNPIFYEVKFKKKIIKEIKIKTELKEPLYEKSIIKTNYSIKKTIIQPINYHYNNAEDNSLILERYIINFTQPNFGKPKQIKTKHEKWKSSPKELERI